MTVFSKESLGTIYYKADFTKIKHLQKLITMQSDIHLYLIMEERFVKIFQIQMFITGKMRKLTVMKINRFTLYTSREK